MTDLPAVPEIPPEPPKTLMPAGDSAIQGRRAPELRGLSWKAEEEVWVVSIRSSPAEKWYDRSPSLEEALARLDFGRAWLGMPLRQNLCPMCRLRERVNRVYCVDCHRRVQGEHRRLHRVRVQELSRNHSREWARRRRLQVIEAYGGRCSCCGESQEIFLALDHVNDDGGKERKEVGGDGRRIYKRAIEEGFPPRFQLLCHNCNYAKSRGGCPHVRLTCRATV